MKIILHLSIITFLPRFPYLTEGATNCHTRHIYSHQRYIWGSSFSFLAFRFLKKLEDFMSLCIQKLLCFTSFISLFLLQERCAGGCLIAAWPGKAVKWRMKRMIILIMIITWTKMVKQLADSNSRRLRNSPAYNPHKNHISPKCKFYTEQ